VPLLRVGATNALAVIEMLADFMATTGYFGFPKSQFTSKMDLCKKSIQQDEVFYLCRNRSIYV